MKEVSALQILTKYSAIELPGVGVGWGVTTPSNLDLVKVLITLIAVRPQFSAVFAFLGGWICPH